MPNSLLEAMACGLPVVAPPSAAPAELIDAEIGFFPPSNEPHELLAMLERLAPDNELRAAMGEAARQRAMAYDIERVALEYETLYQSLARSG
jgi:L-malate glycosyltransferase